MQRVDQVADKFGLTGPRLSAKGARSPVGPAPVRAEAHRAELDAAGQTYEAWTEVRGERVSLRGDPQHDA